MNKGAIYHEGWPRAATLFVGSRGTLPKIGEVVPVHNFMDDTDREGVVISRSAKVREYTIKIEGR